MNPLIWMRYAPTAMLVQCMDMAPEVELAHRRLCDWVWAHGEAPTDQPPLLQGITRVAGPEWARVSRLLRSKGWKRVEGRLTHPWAEQVLREAIEAHASAVSRGKRGGRPKAQLKPSSRSAKSSAQADGKAELKPGLSTAKSSAKAEPKHKPYSTVPNPTNRTEPTNEPPLSCLTDEQFISSSASKGRDGETEFMSDLKETLAGFNRKAARVEMETWGGLWRNRFRAYPEKARRVLAELKGMVRERRVTRNAGACANDLWGRFA